MKNKNNSFYIELIEFIIENKKWWLFPLIFCLIIIGFLIVFSLSSPVAPIIYPMI